MAAEPAPVAPGSAELPATAHTATAVPLAPQLRPPASVPVSRGPAADIDRTVTDLHQAIRRKQYALAEAYLGTLPTDTGGYRDLVAQLAILRKEQTLAYDSLGNALLTRRLRDLANAVESASAYADLATAAEQTRTYLTQLQDAYDKTFAHDGNNSPTSEASKSSTRTLADQRPVVPLLVPPASVPQAGAPAGNPLQTVTDLRLSLRRKQYALAEVYLAILPADTTGYRDLVTLLGTLRRDQTNVHQALGAALAAQRCGELATTMELAATYPDLTAAVAQVRGWLETVQGNYEQILGRVDSALTAKDAATARSWLATIPAEAALLPPVISAKRQAAERALANLAP